MMQRRSFLKNAARLGSSVALGSRGIAGVLPSDERLGAVLGARPAAVLPDSPAVVSPGPVRGKRIGIIGLDTSHSVEFTKVLNATPADASNKALNSAPADARNIAPADAPYKGYRVTAAYPYGSRTIASSYNRIPDYIEKVKAFQVAICSSLEELLDQVDCVLLETNDGHLHPEQAAKVFQSRKPVFIDKPLGANLGEVKQVFKASARYGASFFTSSALRYTSAVTEIRAAAGPLQTVPGTQSSAADEPLRAAAGPGGVLG